jgi:phosphohistidine phosphatase
MRLVTLVRHGRAEPQKGATTDFGRPLDRQGVREVHATARELAQLECLPECILASPAQRTRQTATLLARAFALDERQVVLEERLYLAPPEELLGALRRLSPGVLHALLVGHNPGLSELARRLAPAAGITDLPTGALCLITLAAPDWGTLAFGDGRRITYRTPEIGPDAPS